MGNTSTKESRPPFGHSGRHGRHPSGEVQGSFSGNSRHRGPDLSLLGIAPERDAALEPRRETKQEREARRRERERAARLKERERSMKEEHVDGGYLVTQGVYVGPEDFSKTVVRQLMVWLPPWQRAFSDRELIIPFWRDADRAQTCPFLERPKRFLRVMG